MSTNTGWRKSTYSQNNGGQCVEVAGIGGRIAVRDSKDNSGPVLEFAVSDWTSFADCIRSGHFDG